MARRSPASFIVRRLACRSQLRWPQRHTHVLSTQQVFLCLGRCGRLLSHVCFRSLSRQDTVSLALGGGTTTSVSSPGDGIRSSVPANSAFGAAKFAADAAAAAAAEAAAKQNKSSGSFYA